MTLERTDSSEVPLYADDTIRNLPQVQVDEEVTAAFYKSLTDEVKRRATSAQGG